MLFDRYSRSAILVTVSPPIFKRDWLANWNGSCGRWNGSSMRAQCTPGTYCPS